jgi:hypothetical protein
MEPAVKRGFPARQSFYSLNFDTTVQVSLAPSIETWLLAGFDGGAQASYDTGFMLGELRF